MLSSESVIELLDEPKYGSRQLLTELNAMAEEDWAWMIQWAAREAKKENRLLYSVPFQWVTIG